MNRREFLRTTSAAAGATAATTEVTGAATAQEGGSGSGPIDYGGYLDDATGWGGDGSTVDMTGKKKVTIKVGPGAENKFDPVAVHVDPGTKIVWKWESAGHNVHAQNDEFKSQIKGSGTFEYSVKKKKGIIPYWCDPHKSLGMKGAIAIGKVPHKSAAAQEIKPEEMGVPIQPHYVGIATVLMMISSLVFTFYLLKYGESAHTKGGNS